MVAVLQCTNTGCKAFLILQEAYWPKGLGAYHLDCGQCGEHIYVEFVGSSILQD